MSLAIAYQMKKRGHKMAHGGMAMEGPCEAHGTAMCKMCHGGEYAKGGDIERDPHIKGVHQVGTLMNEGPGDSRAGDFARSGYKHERPGEVGIAKEEHRKVLNEMRSMKKPNLYAEGGEVDEEEASGYEHDPMEHESHEDSHAVENQGFPEDERDMVSRIMKQREKHYSEGGRIANEDHVESDFEPNEFDDLAKDDHLEEHYTGENSGDELGDEQEDEDRHDIVSRIMKSRRLKDRNPRIT